MNEWMPIETAPKDGRDLWLYVPKEVPGQVVGYWDAPSQEWQYREGLVADVAGFIDGPTHWMHLPLSPEVTNRIVKDYEAAFFDAHGYEMRVEACDGERFRLWSLIGTGFYPRSELLSMTANLRRISEKRKSQPAVQGA